MKNSGHTLMLTDNSNVRVNSVRHSPPSAAGAARDHSKVTVVLDPRGIAFFPGNIQKNLVNGEQGKEARVPGYGRVYPVKRSFSEIGWLPESVRNAVTVLRVPVVINRSELPAHLRHLV